MADSPLEQSSPPQPGSHWQVSGDTQRPWAHSSVQSAEEEEEDRKVKVRRLQEAIQLIR